MLHLFRVRCNPTVLRCDKVYIFALYLFYVKNKNKTIFYLWRQKVIVIVTEFAFSTPKIINMLGSKSEGIQINHFI